MEDTLKRLKIGVIGCGAIGSELARSIETRFFDKATLEAVYEIDEERAKNFVSKLKYIPQLCNLEDLVDKVDLVIEAASLTVVPEVLRLAIEKGKDILVLSVGGLFGQEELMKEAEAKGVQIHIPSGAIGGMDAVKAAHIGGIKSIQLETIKPPMSYDGAPYVINEGIDLSKIDKETVLFEGSAEEAIKGFPRNINVSAILSFCGLGQKKTKVKIVASPDTKWNSHEVTLEGTFGRFKARADNLPLESNPKTSALSPLSAIALLRQILSNFKVGS